MLKRMNKTFAVITLVVVMAISAMAIPVSAVSPKSNIAPMAVPSRWLVIIGTTPNKCSGTVTDLVYPIDRGLSFMCTGYDSKGAPNESLYAICKLADSYSYLSKIPGKTVRIDRVTSNEANRSAYEIEFIDGWYNYCHGTVDYTVQVAGAVAGQAMEGYAY